MFLREMFLGVAQQMLLSLWQHMLAAHGGGVEVAQCFINIRHLGSMAVVAGDASKLPGQPMEARSQ